MTKKLWTVHSLLAAVFLFAGTMKLVLPIAVLTAQVPLPGGFVRFLGICEVLGALGLILPEAFGLVTGLTALAAAGLAIIMAGATIITLLIGGGASALLPLALGSALIYVIRQFFHRQPDSLRVERSIRIQAPADAIFPLVDDFRRWTEWSPYEKLDPAVKRTYSGPSSGIGSAYEWSGNGKAGAGRIETIDSVRNRSLQFHLHFLRPFEGHKTAEFTFTQSQDATTVTWAIYGEQQTLCKFVGSLIPMDRMMGGEFEKGLGALKALAEEANVTSAVR